MVTRESLHFRSLIEWSKDNRMLHRGKKNSTRDKRHIGKAFVTAKGSLRIKRLSYADAGVYTCSGSIFFSHCLSISIKTLASYLTRARPNPTKIISR